MQGKSFLSRVVYQVLRASGIQGKERVLGCRRRDAEIQHWKGLANQARAEGQALQGKRDEEAALYSEQVQQALASYHPACFITLLIVHGYCLTALYVHAYVWLALCMHNMLAFAEQLGWGAAQLG